MSLFNRSTQELQDAQKKLVRLRLELHREQLLHNSQSLTHPLRHAQQLLRETSHPQQLTQSSGQWMTGLLLNLFAKRLGHWGTIARIGLALYPFIQEIRRIPHPLSNRAKHL